MKGRLIVAGLLLAVALGVAPWPAAAQDAPALTGGGTATQCKFALQVVLPGDGSATGHLDLLMAGHLALTLPDGTKLSLLHLQGQVSGGSINPDGSVTFSGSGSTTKKVADSSTSLEIPTTFTVTARPGGAGSGHFDAVITDATGSVTLHEDVVTGMIMLH